MNVSQRLRDARERLGLTQLELAALAKVSIGTISNAERGKFTPNDINLYKLSKALGESLDAQPEGA